MSPLAKVVLERAPWDAQAEEWSRRLPHDLPAGHMLKLADEVHSGRADAYAVLVDGERKGVLVASVDTSFPRPEFIVLGAFAAGTHASIAADLGEQVDRLAAARGCASIRFHTMRPGLIVRALRKGYRISEVILRKNVPTA